MMMVEEPKLSRYAVAVFDERGDLRATERALRRVGSVRPDTSVLGLRAEVERWRAATDRAGEPRFPSPGSTMRRNGGLEPDPAGDAAAVGLIEIGADGLHRAVVTSAGALADLLLQAGAGPDRHIGPVLKTWIPGKQAAFLEDQLGRGGLLLWVRIQDPEHEASVCRVLLKHSRYRVQVHDLKAMGPAVSGAK